MASISQLKWSNNWDRAYRISIGTRPIPSSKYVINTPVVIATAQNYSIMEDNVTIPSDARLLSNLESDGFTKRGFTFKLNSSHKATKDASSGETTTLDLYNIDSDLVDIINKDHCVVIVEAGYEGKVELAYTGDVVRVDISRVGADTVYKLHCRSGANDMKNTLISSTYDQTLNMNEILIDMMSKFPTSTVGIVGIGSSGEDKKTGGKVFNGPLISNVNKMVEDNNLIWSHFNGKIVTIPYKLTSEDYDLFSRTNYNLPPDILKKVSNVSDRKGKGDNSSESKLRKLQVNTFFIPIEIGQFITIPNTEYTKGVYGTYQVKARRLILESQGSAWDVVLEVEELG